MLMRGYRKIILAIAILVLLVGLGTAIYLYVSKKNSRQVLSASVAKQLDFSPYIVTEKQRISQPENVKYNAGSKVLVYNQNFEGAKLTITQQATPESLVDIPQAYDKLIEKMHQESAFDSYSGRVYITSPTELNGNQAAVLNSGGTLMFVRADKKISTDNWKFFFNKLEQQRLQKDG